MPYTDQDLFRLIADQHERAFNEIYRKYHPVLFSCVKRMLKSDTYAKDLVHDVFIQLWQGGESLTMIQNPAGWLRRLAANHTINHLKKEARERQLRLLLRQEPGVVSGEAVINFRELEAIVNKVVMKLPLDTGVVLRASIEKGLSRDQIARELGLSVATVKNKLEYGRRVLREHVRAYAGIYLPWVLIAAAVVK